MWAVGVLVLDSLDEGVGVFVMLLGGDEILLIGMFYEMAFVFNRLDNKFPFVRKELSVESSFSIKEVGLGIVLITWGPASSSGDYWCR